MLCVCSSLSWCGRGADLQNCCLVAGPTQLPRAGVARALCLHAPLCCIKASPLLNKSLVLLSLSLWLAEVGFQDMMKNELKIMIPMIIDMINL